VPTVDLKQGWNAALAIKNLLNNSILSLQSENPKLHESMIKNSTYKVKVFGWIGPRSINEV